MQDEESRLFKPSLDGQADFDTVVANLLQLPEEKLLLRSHELFKIVDDDIEDNYGRYPWTVGKHLGHNLLQEFYLYIN